MKADALRDRRSEWDRLSGKLGLSEWLFWALILGGGTAFLFFSIYSGSTTGAASSILLYVALGVIALIAVFQSFQAAVVVRNEAQLAARQAQELIDGMEIAGLLQTAKPSFFKHHISNLYQIMRTDRQIDQETLILLMQDRLIARNRQSQLMASILVTVGLIGTIAGLIGMTAAMKTSLQGFDSEQTDQFVSALFQEGGALSSLDLAFYTTLIGATLGGVVMRILAGIVEKNITVLVSQIAELSEVHVVPALRKMARELEAQGFYDRT